MKIPGLPLPSGSYRSSGPLSSGSISASSSQKSQSIPTNPSIQGFRPLGIQVESHGLCFASYSLGAQTGFHDFFPPGQMF